jgi:hypothetical protein
MNYNQKKTPLMAGLERELMKCFLKQVKRVRGLTSTLDKKAGINGKWTKPYEPYDISVTKALKILAYKAFVQDEDEFLEDARLFRAYVIEVYMKNDKTTGDNRKHRPPCRRRLLRRRYPVVVLTGLYF